MNIDTSYFSYCKLSLSRLCCGTISNPIVLQQEGPGFDSQAEVCLEFTCSPHTGMGSPWVLHLPPTVQKPACLVKWLPLLWCLLCLSL